MSEFRTLSFKSVLPLLLPEHMLGHPGESPVTDNVTWQMPLSDGQVCALRAGLSVPTEDPVLLLTTATVRADAQRIDPKCAASSGHRTTGSWPRVATTTNCAFGS